MTNLLLQLADRFNIPYTPDDEYWARFVAGPAIEKGILFTLLGAIALRALDIAGIIQLP